MKRLKHTVVLLGLSLVLITKYQSCGYPVALSPEDARFDLTSQSVATEGEPIEVRIFISDRKFGVPQTLNYRITNCNIGTPNDFDNPEGELTIDPSVTVEEMVTAGLALSIPTKNDNLYEGTDAEKCELEIIDSTGNYLPESLKMPIFIADNDTVPEIQVVAENSGIGPENSDLNFTANLSHPSAFPITAKLEGFNVDDFSQPIFNQDFVIAQSEIHFAPEQTTTSFTLTFLPDAKKEPTEVGSFILNPGADAIVAGRVGFTITDGTTITVGRPPVVQTIGNVHEGGTIRFEFDFGGVTFAGGLNLNYKLKVRTPANTTFDVTDDLNVPVVGNLGSYAKASDFVPGTVFDGTVSIDEDESVLVVEFKTQDDNIVEAREVVELEASMADFTSPLLTPAEVAQIIGALPSPPYLATIRDRIPESPRSSEQNGEIAELTLQPVPSPIDEAAITGTETPVNIVVTASNPTAFPIKGRGVTVDGTAKAVVTGPDQPDYQALPALPANFTLQADEINPPSATFQVLVKQDTIYEAGGGDEKFSVELVLGSTVAPELDPNTHVVKTSGNSHITEVTIIDDEALPNVNLVRTSGSLESQGSMDFALVNNGNLSSTPITFKVKTEEIGVNEATKGIDFEDFDGGRTFSIPALATTGTFSVALPDAGDGIFENKNGDRQEDFRISISNIRDAGTSTIIQTFEILDDDPMPQLIVESSNASPSDFTYNENGDSGSDTHTIKVVRVGGSDVSTTATLVSNLNGIIGDTVTIGGSFGVKDVDPINSSINIPPSTGNRSQSVTMRIYKDKVGENNESFNLSLNNEVNAIVPSASQSIVVTIIDDDVPVPSIVVSNSVTEGAQASVTINLNPVPTYPVKCNFSTEGKESNGALTASENNDFSKIVNAPQSFNFGSTTIDIGTGPDTIYEGSTDETFKVILTGCVKNPGNGDQVIYNGTPEVSAIISISDNDPKPEIKLTSSATQFLEPDSGSFFDQEVVVQRLAGSEVDSKFKIASSTSVFIPASNSDFDLKDTLGSDLTTGQITIPASVGPASFTFKVRIEGDDSAENHENFKVLISSSGLENVVRHSTESELMFKIFNNDLELNLNNVGSSSHDEEDADIISTVIELVSSTKPIPFDLKCDLTAVDGTGGDKAELGSDYSLRPAAERLGVLVQVGSITTTSGPTVQVAEIIDDVVQDGNSTEKFRLKLESCRRASDDAPVVRLESGPVFSSDVKIEDDE